MQGIIYIGYFWFQRIYALGRRKAACFLIKRDDCQLFCKRRAFRVERAVLVIGATGAVKGIDVLAVILDTRAVYIYGWRMDGIDGFPKDDGDVVFSNGKGELEILTNTSMS